MPEQSSYTLRNFTVICNVVLASTYLVIAAISGLLIISFSIDHNLLTLGPLAVCGIALLYTVVNHWLLRHHHYHTVAYSLVIFYLLIAAGIVWTWGMNTPIGTLILGLVIVLAGILLTARHALYAAIVSGALLIIAQTTFALGWHKPDTSWVTNDPCFGDVLAYGVVFFMLALVSWLYNREMESSLIHARQARKALLQQKATLKMQVKMRTAQLRQAQLEEMQQMYRFTELGQYGVTLLHDLANHLTALTLEMEDLQSRQHSKAIMRARRIIRYLDGVVENTRDRLHGGTQKHQFDPIKKITETITFLRYKAAEVKVAIEWQPPSQTWHLTGDPANFCQVIAILTNNGIDAYGPPDGATTQARLVAVSVQHTNTQLVIRIGDWGKGITKSKRKDLFKPMHSSKKSGLGLGLYIAKQIVELQFSGSISINPKNDHTEFIIKLPLKNAE